MCRLSSVLLHCSLAVTKSIWVNNKHVRFSNGLTGFQTIGKGKVFPYSLLSVGPGADPGVQAVSPQVT